MLPVHLHCFDVGILAQQHPIRSSNRTQSPTTELYPDFREASSDHLPHATCSSYCVLGPVPDTRGRDEWVMAKEKRAKEKPHKSHRSVAAVKATEG